MPVTQPANGQPPTAESCLRRAASLLEEAERPTTSPTEAALKVQVAAGWRELGLAAGYLEDTHNAGARPSSPA